MTESNSKKFNRLFDGFNFATDGILWRNEDGSYSLSYRVLGEETTKGCKIIFRTQKIKNGSQEHVLLTFDDKEVALSSGFGSTIINRIRSDHFVSVDKNKEGIGTGHVLAKAYIENYGTCDGIFYSRIGTEKKIQFDAEINSDILKDISEAVLAAKKQDRQPNATLFVSCRYVDNHKEEQGHDICIVVNKNKFNPNKGEKLGPDDCQIFDSSGVIVDWINRPILSNIKKQLGKVIDLSRIHEYHYFNNSLYFQQIGPRCSDYASRVYLNLNDFTSNFATKSIPELKERRLYFELDISKNMLSYYNDAIKENEDRMKIKKKLRNSVNLYYAKHNRDEIITEINKLEACVAKRVTEKSPLNFNVAQKLATQTATTTIGIRSPKLKKLI